jgi:hypothetical protein
MFQKIVYSSEERKGERMEGRREGKEGMEGWKERFFLPFFLSSLPSFQLHKVSTKFLTKI